jgi:twitching motility protein PilT
MHSLFDRAVAAARQLGASDVHLKAGLAPILRIHGELRTLRDVPPLSREFIHSLAMSMLNDRRREMFERSGDVGLSLSTAEGARQRVHVWQHRGGVAIAVRLVPPEVPPLAKLELPACAASLAAPGPALVLVAGGAGSGRTTTLAALIDHLGGERACHVITVEDPVEFMLRDRRSVVAQREVGLDAPSAAAALRAAARQDADVLGIGDLRDGDSAELALTAVETGRLVLAGIAGRDALDAVRRLVGLFPAAEQETARRRVAALLRGSLALQLCARADGKGRVPAADVLIVDGEGRDRLRAAGGDAELRARMAAERPAGSTTFDRSLAALVHRRRITREEALARADDPAGVARALPQAALGVGAADAEGRGAAGRDGAADNPQVEDDARAD